MQLAPQNVSPRQPLHNRRGNPPTNLCRAGRARRPPAAAAVGSQPGTPPPGCRPATPSGSSPGKPAQVGGRRGGRPHQMTSAPQHTCARVVPMPSRTRKRVQEVSLRPTPPHPQAAIRVQKCSCCGQGGNPLLLSPQPTTTYPNLSLSPPAPKWWEHGSRQPTITVMSPLRSGAGTARTAAGIHPQTHHRDEPADGRRRLQRTLRQRLVGRVLQPQRQRVAGTQHNTCRGTAPLGASAGYSIPGDRIPDAPDSSGTGSQGCSTTGSITPARISGHLEPASHEPSPAPIPCQILSPDRQTPPNAKS